MSCSLKKLVTFEDKLPTIKNILFADDLNSPVPSSIDEWSSQSIHEEISDDATSNTNLISGSLNDCIIGISPNADLIVFIHDINVAVYRCREESDKQIYGTTLYELEPGEKITCVTCLPFVSQQVSNQGGPDWCALILGFSSGYIRVYTENMSLLLAQKISSEPVNTIKVNSFQCPYTSGRTRHFNCNKKVDEIFIFCRTICIIIEGFVFYQTLRSCRNYLARGQSMPDSSINPEFSIRFKTWQFKNFNRIICADNCASQEISDYDYLVARSISKGTYSNPHNRRMSMNLIISAGEDPFVGLRWADENDSTSVLEEVTQAVVNKVKNVLPTFLRSSDKPKPKVDPPLDFSSNLEFYDQYRFGVSISVSPTRELAAVCDEFGRVCLVNLTDGLMIRMWKGYRDAQCGWVESCEDSENINSRKVTFLCIYAPKRGLLELWRCQHGPRVDAFNVGKSCRLLYCEHSMLGLNDALVNQYRQSFGLRLHSPGSCYLLDYDSCSLYAFQVPFVVSLTDRFSRLSKDQLLLKEFTNLSVSDENNFPHHLNLFEKIKTHKVKWQAIDHVIGHSMVTLVKDLCQSFSSQLPTDSELTDQKFNIDPSILISACRCQKLIQLCQFYSAFSKMVSKIGPTSLIHNINRDPPDIESQVELLGWSAREYVRCVSIFGFAEIVTPGKEKQISLDVISFSEFVNFFVPNQPEEPVNQKSSQKTNPLPKKIPRKYTIEQLARIGDLILLPAIYMESLENCASLIESATLIAPQELLYCLFASWLQTDFSSNWRYWPRFNRYVALIVNFLRQKYSSGQEQWLMILKIICSLIAQSTLIPSALISSMVLLTFYSQFNLCEEANASRGHTSVQDESHESVVPEEWESLSIVKEKLNLLINQLESTFFLSLTLHSNVNHDPGNISLAYLRDSLPGIISELIAKWAISYPLDPSIILSLENDELDENEQAISSPQIVIVGTDVVASEESIDKIDTDVIKQLLAKVREKFPYSMESDTLLANLTWECLILWDKDPSMGATSKLLTQSLKYLEPISSAVLKHNLACLIWKMSIRKRVETLTLLIEKMGKTPKDRILKRDIGIGEGSLEDFVKYVFELIDLIVFTLGPAESDAMPIFRLDDWWKYKSWTNNQHPLVFIAIQQKPADPDLILQLYDLSLVLNLIVNFQIKQHKPLSLFPFDVQKALFGELSFPLANAHADSRLTENRKNFLFSAASAVAYSVPPATSIVEEEVQLYSIANQWMGKIVSLAKHWEIKPDLARQRYICDLYLNCCDALAEEVINMVHDRDELAVVLLPVAGQRILHLIKPEKDKFIASTPLYVLGWLENIPLNQQINLNFTAATTTKMLEYILSLLSSDHSKRRIVRNLLEITHQFE